MKGFYSSLTVVQSRQPPTLIPQCGACGLSKKCISPFMPVSGKGKRKILVIGEAPGENEDRQNKQFVGVTGQYLEEIMGKAGVDLRRDCWLTNSLTCRPSNNKIPSLKHVDYCRPNLIKTIKELQPELIIPLGGTAVRSLIGWIWKENTKGINRWIGWHIPCQELNAWICPAWHPSFVKRNDYGLSGQDRGQGNEVREMLFERQIADAVGHVGRPYNKVPSYDKRIHLCFSPDDAIPLLDQFAERRSQLAFDYETDRLKPDADGSGIVSCSFSDGKTAVAYPWHGKVVERTKELLHSSIPKIAHNLRFEDRWTRKVFGKGVKGWLWDSMVAAHVLDSRPGISGLKFQAFVLLGLGDYDEHLKDFMKSETSNSRNRLHEAPIETLLKYNALDALLTHKIAAIQMKQMGVI